TSVSLPASGLDVEGNIRSGIPYKTLQEVWLEYESDQYNAEIAKSPLERGKIIIDTLFLNCCFAEFTVGSSSASRSPLATVNVGAPGLPATSRPSTNLESYRRAVVAWNTGQQALHSALMANSSPTTPFRLDDESSVMVYLRSLAFVQSSHPGNEPLGS